MLQYFLNETKFSKFLSQFNKRNFFQSSKFSKKNYIIPQNHTIQWFLTPKMAYVMRFDTPGPYPLGTTSCEGRCYVFPPPPPAWLGLSDWNGSNG